jgi:hypothetical protein
MAKTKIFKRDGSPTPYFWSDNKGEDRTKVTVYKQTESGVKRMRGVLFNTVTNRMKKV